MKNKIKSILKSNKGFTLVELIIVIAIIAVLSAILVPRITGFVGEARETAQLATARTIWFAAEYAWQGFISEQKTFDDFMVELESLLPDNAVLGPDLSVTVNNERYRITVGPPNGDLIVIGPGNISYPN